MHKTLLNTLSVNTLSSPPARFIQMAPLYYFYNLPPSESKDILQNILNHGASQYQEQKPPTFQEEPQENQTYDRCIIQWLTVPSGGGKITSRTCTVLYKSTLSG